MKWIFKSKEPDLTLERLANTINRINSNNLVSASDSTFYATNLPFYEDFKLYTFIDLSFTPYLEMKLLDNVKYTFIIDGTQNAFIEANKLSPLVLTIENVYEYAMLVLGNTKKNDYSYRLVNSVDEINFSTEPTFAQYQQLESSIKPPRIKKEKDNFIIKATILYGDSVVKASIIVSLNGRVDITKEKIVLDNMPVQELILD